VQRFVLGAVDEGTERDTFLHMLAHMQPLLTF
jgi:hypothetical protein